LGWDTREIYIKKNEKYTQEKAIQEEKINIQGALNKEIIKQGFARAGKEPPPFK